MTNERSAVLTGTLLHLISVGNTRTRFAVATDGELQPSLTAVNEGDDLTGFVDAVRASLGRPDGRTVRVAIASVNTQHSDRINIALRESGLLPNDAILRFGRELPISIKHTLADETTVGQDRLLSALGAFWRSRQACVVIDAGTAITVDFVDGVGVFHGGAIAPGVRMMARALHEQTSALPLVNIGPEEAERFRAQQASTLAGDDEAEEDGPDGGGAHEGAMGAREGKAGGQGGPPFGKDTPSAIALGVLNCAAAGAHALIDRYAEFYGAYPIVVATGGDAALLFENDPLVDRIVPDLTLIGMLAAYERLVVDDSEHAGSSPG